MPGRESVKRIPAILLAIATGPVLVASLDVAADRRVEGTARAVDAGR